MESKPYYDSIFLLKNHNISNSFLYGLFPVIMLPLCNKNGLLLFTRSVAFCQDSSKTGRRDKEIRRRES